MSEIHHITENSDLYPPLLREIHHPPVELFIRGNIHLLQHPHLLAVVGSRRASTYGKQCVTQLLPPAVLAGAVPVSGLAYGIDSLAHRTAVDLQLPTIAVLGSGIDDASIYPRINIALAHKIISFGGALISEYPPGTPAYPYNFPARNRIISGLCQATIIVQAARRSGSLVTARLALEANRDVAIIPGPINDPRNAGTNELLLHGAIPIISPEQVADLVGLTLPANNAAPEQISLTATQQKIMDILSDKPLHLDTITERSQLPSPTIAAIITELELFDLIQHAGGQTYLKIKQTT
ncbi:MAG: DNA-processing protein DprA [Candidatus Andersenbacteria bacterium]|nr:DNA-processing protein DprA [bacterium]MDZ4225704.1 DNA-processing protein DprA [Candidatus Andersenbacteria bacterium]